MAEFRITKTVNIREYLGYGWVISPNFDKDRICSWEVLKVYREWITPQGNIAYETTTEGRPTEDYNFMHPHSWHISRLLADAKEWCRKHPNKER